jgi:very-short-patch-repair endonuclease
MEELNKSMYFGAKSVTIETARLLRNRMTTSESLLWEKLKGKQLMGLRFRRQHPIDFFIADFYCHQARLVIEIDGEIHQSRNEYDIGREAEMEKYKIKVIRFTNADVDSDLDMVLTRIRNIATERLKSPPWGI